MAAYLTKEEELEDRIKSLERQVKNLSSIVVKLSKDFEIISQFGKPPTIIRLGTPESILNEALNYKKLL